MEAYFNIGGSVLRITGGENVISTCDGMLPKFRMDPAPWDMWMDVSFQDQLEIPAADPVYEDMDRRVWETDGATITLFGDHRAPFMRLCRRGKKTSVEGRRSYYRKAIPNASLLYAVEAEHLIVAGGGFLLHSAFIEYKGKAILFTAPSGTGKSTQAALWERLRGARVINGDRSVVRRGGEQGFEAHGIPFCGSSGISEPARLPLAAIVVLSQAPKTQLRPLTGIRAFRAIWEGCSLHTWNSDDVARCSKTVGDAVAQVPIYHLACTPDESAVLALEETLRK